jgi:chromosome segregation ATPase
MKQYFSGFFTAICLSVSFVMFTASNNDNLGDITVNSIKVVDNQNGGFITTYNNQGEITTYIGSVEGGSGKVASYDKNNFQYSIQSVADKDRKQNEELTNRVRENEIRTISRENDMYEAQELISENNDLIYSSYDELSAEIDQRIELFRKKLEEREEIIKNTVEKLAEYVDDVTDNKQMIVENTQEIHQAFEAIMENTETLRHTKETLTKRLMELYGPY